MPFQAEPPIIVNANGDVYCYGTLEECALDLEVPDVRNGEYEIFDSEGRVLMPEVISESFQEIVRIRPTHEKKAEHLREVLVSFFTFVGRDEAELRSLRIHELATLGLRESHP